MTNDKLAMYGGKPVRTTLFKSRPYITEKMKAMVLETIEDGRFSKFIGSPVPGTLDLLTKKSEEIDKISEMVSFFGGPSVRKLEALWAQSHECGFSIAVNSATSGLTTAFMAVDVGPGCEVMCSPFSFTASATAIVAANAVPVFADIDIDTFCLSPESCENSITHATRAIMPIHWNSNAGDLSSLLSLAKSKNLHVIEDAAQTPKTIYDHKYLGTHGEVGVFSLNEPKNVMTGEGGIIVTDDKALAAKCRLIRNHGEAVVDQSFTNEMATNIVGHNFRLVEMLAALGIGQLDHLEYLNSIRRENYLYLTEKLVSTWGEFIVPQKITHPESYNPYTAGFRWLSSKSCIHRNVIARALRAEGIPVSSGVSRLMSDNPLFQRTLAYGQGGCPFSCHLYERRGKYGIPPLQKAKQLQEEEYLGFFQIGWPNGREDMDDIIYGFNKILANKKRLEGESVDKDNSFISGR